MDEKKRCKWVAGKSAIYLEYHDNEWGVPSRNENHLYEMFLLELFQAGLSWITILKKRENFREAFDNFDIDLIAEYNEDKIEDLMKNKGIIRNRRKIEAAILNTHIIKEIQKEFGSFSKYIWGFTDNKVIVNTDNIPHVTTKLSDDISKDMKKRGMKFAGSITVYSYLQAVGIINDHDTDCFRHDLV